MAIYVPFNEARTKAEYEKEKADRVDAEKAKEKERDARRYPGLDRDSTFSMYSSPGDKERYNSFFTRDENRYKGEGNRSDYIITSKEDADRSEKARKIVEDEKEKRYKENNKKFDEYKKYGKEANEELDKMVPKGNRPTGAFKGKEKKEWDRQYNKYLGAEEIARTHEEKLRGEWEDARKAYNRAGTPEAHDAANRHIRRHPKQYKESYGIFESAEMI